MEQEVIEKEVTKTQKLIHIEKICTLTKKQNLFILSLVFVAAFILLSTYWLKSNTGNVTLEQLIFHLKVPMEGANTQAVWDYIAWTFLRTFLIILLVSCGLYFFEKKLKTNVERKKEILYFASKCLLVASIIITFGVMNVWGFIKNQITASTFIEEEYVNPLNVDIIFPEQKQNLIYIYLESMESTYSSIESGGMFKENRIPELTQIANSNISFSNTDKLGGALDLKGTQWTIAAMVSHTSGLPLKISIGENDYGRHTTFLPGAYTLGEVLEDNGYKNYLLIGSESEFGGRKSYFENHGNYSIWDYNSALEEGRMTKEQKVWWGYSDDDLFMYAKEQLLEISQKDEPFNYTMLTVDTHFTDGYNCADCKETFEDKYSNVIRCSSKKVSEFISWIQKQAFYENTTIIVTGDHLTMQASTEEMAKNNGYEERAVYNTIINSKATTTNTKNRKYFTIDMYPTTLAALGISITGNRLGLGTNLFSEEQTLAEKYGVGYVREELEKKSTFYNRELIYNN